MPLGRIDEDESIAGHEREAMVPCSGDDDSVCWVLVKVAWEAVGLDGNLKGKVKKSDARRVFLEPRRERSIEFYFSLGFLLRYLPQGNLAKKEPPFEPRLFETQHDILGDARVAQGKPKPGVRVEQVTRPFTRHGVRPTVQVPA